MTVPISNLRATWSDSSITYTALGMNVNATSYSSQSNVIHLKVNDVPVFSINVSGRLISYNDIVANNKIIANNVDILSVLNSAFTQANTGATGNLSLVFDTANNAYNRANIAIANVNFVNTAMQAAFATANAAGGGGAALAAAAYDKANSANLLAFNTGIGANAFTSATIAGANTAVGTGANAFTSATIAGANNFLLAVIAGANTAVGTGANNYQIAIQNGANTAVGSGANAYATATIAGANTAIGTGANAFTSATISGANTAVGTGANAFTSATIAGANTAVGTGANAYATATIAGANTAVGVGANSISIVAFDRLNIAVANLNFVNTAMQAAFATANAAGGGSGVVASAAYDKANSANYFAFLINANTTAAFNKANIAVANADSTIEGNLTIKYSFGVGTTASGINGEIRAANNIIAYFSDRRLKTDIVNINNALDKIKLISGVYFRNNETAAKLGFNDQSQQIGVIAQDVQNVLPHVIKPAPFDSDNGITSKSGENYLTVQYDKLVPLLIEAIKELDKKIEDLTKRPNS